MNKLPNFTETRRRCGHNLHVRPQNNAARERSRVKTLRSAFLELQRSLPAIPPNTKLSKLDVLVLATAYIYHLTTTLEGQVHKPTLSRGGQEFEAEESRNQGHNSVSSKLTGQKHLSVSEFQDEESEKRLLSVHAEHKHSKTPLPSSHSSTLITSSDHVHKTQDYKKSHEVSAVNLKIWGNANPGKKSSGTTTKLSCRCPLYWCKEETRQEQMEKLKNGSQTLQLCARDELGLRKVNKTARTLTRGPAGILHPVKKWPMRSRLYDSILGCTSSSALLPSHLQSTTSSLSCSGCNLHTDFHHEIV